MKSSNKSGTVVDSDFDDSILGGSSQWRMVTDYIVDSLSSDSEASGLWAGVAEGNFVR